MSQSGPDRRRWMTVAGTLAVALVGAALVLGAVLEPRAASAPRAARPHTAGSRRASVFHSFSRGLVDEQVFQDPSAAVRTRWFAQADAIHSSWVRMRANWYLIAPQRLHRGSSATDPANPGYDWSTLDASVRSASAAHQRVLLQIIGAPTWAEGPDRPAGVEAGSWRPSPTALGAFARALATRYDGHFPDPLHPGRDLPRVTAFQVWNEPNLPIYITPQWTQVGRTFQPASPGIYRAMLNAAYAGITAVTPGAQVVAAGTAPYGDPPGGQRMHPATFLASMLCLSWPALHPLACPDPAHFDILDHHPYSASPTASAIDPADVAVPNLGRLTRILHAAERSGRVLPRGPKSFWVTEISWASNPPERSTTVTPVEQAEYLAEMLYSLWSQGVSNVFWFTVQDVPPQYMISGAGLYTLSGRAKPAAREYAFPFLTRRQARRDTFWGVAPHAGSVILQRRGARGWSSIARVRTGTSNVFEFTRDEAAHANFRAVQGSAVSLPSPFGSG